LRTKIEPILFRLEEIDFLSFPQTIHLLKELLVGFEVLIDIFGMLDPRAEMVTVTHHHKWKIWVSANYHSIESKPANLTVQQFIIRLVEMAEAHSLVSNHAKGFFKMVMDFVGTPQCSFLSTLEKINEFTRVNKILPVSRVIIPAGHRNVKEPAKFTPVFLGRGGGQEARLFSDFSASHKFDHHLLSSMQMGNQKPGSSYNNVKEVLPYNNRW
jgi:hypothetical protein